MRYLAFLSLALIFGVAATQIHSFDIFWQLQSGRYMAETGEFIYRDIFSLAADAPRWEHCWLHDLVVYNVYRVGGYPWLSLLKGGLVALTGLTLMLAGRIRGASWFSICLITLPFFVFPWGGWMDRPQLWTYLFFALFILVLERSLPTHSWLKALWLMPLMAVWANLHAGAILAFPLLAAYLVGYGADALKQHQWQAPVFGKFLLIACGVALAALATPYNLQIYDSLLNAPKLGEDSTVIAQIHNMDWNLTTFQQHPEYYYAVFGAGLLMLVGFRKILLRDLLLLGGLAVMGLRLDRHTPFFLMASGVILPRYLEGINEGLLHRVPPGVRKLLRWVMVLLAIALLSWSVARPYRHNGFFNVGLRAWHYPVQAAEFVKKHELPGNLYNIYEWGGYLMWQLFPEHLVFWDGRSDSIEMFEYGLSISNGKAEWQRVLDRFDVNVIITKTLTIDTGQRYPLLDRLRTSPHWALVFHDEASLVFVRRTAVTPAWLHKFEEPATRIDDTILTEAKLLTESGAWRYKAFWEMANIYLVRRQYPEAYAALQNYLGRAPVPHEKARQMYRMLTPLMNRAVPPDNGG